MMVPNLYTGGMPPQTTRRRSPGEGSVTFDTTRGKWVGRAMIDGKRPKVVRATKKETQKALRDLMREGERGKVADANQTVNMAVRQYRERTLASTGSPFVPTASGFKGIVGQ